MLISDSPDPTIRAKALYLKKEAGIYLHRDMESERKRDTQLQRELNDKLRNIKTNIAKANQVIDQSSFRGLDLQVPSSRNDGQRYLKTPQITSGKDSSLNKIKYKGYELSQGGDYTGVDAEEFKHAFHKYHSETKEGYSGLRLQLKEQEQARQREASLLVMSLKKDKEKREQAQRSKIQNMILKRNDIYMKAQEQAFSIRQKIQSESHLLMP